MDNNIIPTNEELNESVDDILAQIMGSDGGFNEEFIEMYAKYLGGGADDISSVLSLDLSDRSGELNAHERVEYEDPDLAFRPKPDTARRVAERLPENMRGVYMEAEKKITSPEFTSGGEVRYPSMGVGESEERVVFDADWEERARQEAAKREAIRKENMLRGDSTYARMFVSGGTMRAHPANPAYIDPLSDDDFSYFEAPDNTISWKREQSLEEEFGRASDEKPKKGFFRKNK